MGIFGFHSPRKSDARNQSFFHDLAEKQFQKQEERVEEQRRIKWQEVNDNIFIKKLIDIYNNMDDFVTIVEELKKFCEENDVDICHSLRGYALEVKIQNLPKSVRSKAKLLKIGVDAMVDFYECNTSRYRDLIKGNSVDDSISKVVPYAEDLLDNLRFEYKLPDITGSDFTIRVYKALWLSFLVKYTDVCLQKYGTAVFYDFESEHFYTIEKE